MSGCDLVAAEQFATTRAGKLLPRLDAGVGSLVEPECVRPAQTCKRCLTMLGMEGEYNTLKGLNKLSPPKIGTHSKSQCE